MPRRTPPIPGRAAIAAGGDLQSRLARGRRPPRARQGLPRPVPPAPVTPGASRVAPRLFVTYYVTNRFSVPGAASENCNPIGYTGHEGEGAIYRAAARKNTLALRSGSLTLELLCPCPIRCRSTL